MNASKSTMRLCTICARGGSKGFKNKNIQNFFGKPLIAHTIELAKQSQLFAGIAVSSDSMEILEIARMFGADFVIQRPDELATDTAPKLPAIQHCATIVQELAEVKYDTFVDLSVTSPLMLPEDIQNAVSLLEASDANNVITAEKAPHSPYFSMVEQKTDGYVSLVKPGEYYRRQDCPPCFGMNGAIYVWSAKIFFNITQIITSKTLVYEMPADRSIDIDSELDFDMAVFLYARRNNKQIKNMISSMAGA